MNNTAKIILLLIGMMFIANVAFARLPATQIVGSETGRIGRPSVGTSGRLFEWEIQDTNFPNGTTGIRHIHPLDENVVWVLGYEPIGLWNEDLFEGSYRVFTRTTDGGITWTSGGFNGLTDDAQPVMIFALNADEAWVPVISVSGDAEMGLYHTTDGGVNWDHVGDMYSSEDSFPNVVHFFNDNDGFTLGDPVDGYHEMYTTADGGENWTRVPRENIPAPLLDEDGVVGFYDAVDDNIWFGTNKCRVFRSTDKGLNWNVSDVGLEYTPSVDVRFADAKHGLARSSEPFTLVELAETFDGGKTWTPFEYTGDCYAGEFEFVPGTENTWVSVGMEHYLHGASYSFDGGHTWSNFDKTENVQFMTTAWISSTVGWAGEFNDEVSPNVGGMYKFTGELKPTEACSPPENVQVDAETGLVTWGTSRDGVLFSDDFEAYDDFVLDFAPWTLIDVDQTQTYSTDDSDYPHEGEAMAYTIFNPSQATPPIKEMIAYSGYKFAACLASKGVQNDDWMISPQLTLGKGDELAFRAKSFTNLYGLERFQVGVSTTGTDPSDFTIISKGDYEEAPADAWTLFTYNLSDYYGQNVYIGIHCVSDEASIFMVDDVVVRTVTYNVYLDGENIAAGINANEYQLTGLVLDQNYTAGVSAACGAYESEIITVDFIYAGVSADNDIVAGTALNGNYPNPFNPETTISFNLTAESAENAELVVYNVKGQKIKNLVNAKLAPGQHSVVWNGTDDNGKSVSSGIYFYSLSLDGRATLSRKMVLIK